MQRTDADICPQSLGLFIHKACAGAMVLVFMNLMLENLSHDPGNWTPFQSVIQSVVS